MTRPPRERQGLVRPYVVTEGRAFPTRNTFDLVTLVRTTGADSAGLGPKKQRVVQFCEGGALSVAEISARLKLPVGVVKVLLADLVDSGHIAARPPIPPAELPQYRILQEVLDGLRARL